jgi:hypothetical protein
VPDSSQSDFMMEGEMPAVESGLDGRLMSDYGDG